MTKPRYVQRCRFRWLPKALHWLRHDPALLWAPREPRRAMIRFVLPPCMVTEADMEWARRLFAERA